MDLYLSCHTEKEIAKKFPLTRRQIHNIIEKEISLKVKEFPKPPDSYQFFNLWDFQVCNNRYGRKFPRRMPGQIIENLLYYYTDFFDIVLDPMAGSGTTIDVCKAVYRRYL